MNEKTLYNVATDIDCISVEVEKILSAAPKREFSIDEIIYMYLIYIFIKENGAKNYVKGTQYSKWKKENKVDTYILIELYAHYTPKIKYAILVSHKRGNISISGQSVRIVNKHITGLTEKKVINIMKYASDNVKEEISEIRKININL